MNRSAYFLPEAVRHQVLSGADALSKLPSPRIIKTHLPFYLLHPKLLDTSKVVPIFV